jgi:hypothetical protein
MPPRNRNQQPPMTIDEEPLPVMDTGLTFDQLQAMNGVNMTEEDMVAAGMVPDAVANDLATAEPEVRRAEPNMQPTGAFMDLGFINQINAAATDEEATAMYNSLDPVQKRVYDRSFGINISPEWAAGEASKYYEEQDERAKAEMQAATPAARAEQAEVQEAYRQEVEYQRSLATINDSTKSSAERNAARMQIEALSAGIGKRINPKLGTSAAAMNEAKNAVGYIGAYEYKNPLADFGSRISTMQRNSEERLGLLRQQMEASGVLVPEAAPTPAAPNPAQMVLERFGVKAPDGNPVMFNGSPVVSFKRAGKDVMARQTPNGGFVELTAEEAAALLGQ